MPSIKKKLSDTLFIFFWASLFALSPSYSQAFNYCVSQIPYNGIPTPTTDPTSVTLLDDHFSSAIEIGFSFRFFGVDYTQVFIGSNGIVSFNPALAGLLCPPDRNLTPPVDVTPIPNNVTAAQNAILFPWQSLTFNVSPGPSLPPSSIYYYSVGEAPYRQFVVNFNNMYNYLANNFNTQSVILYESTNIIDIVINQKNTSGSFSNVFVLAVEGIQNADGTEAFAVSGRNGTVWALNDDTVRFSPMASEPGTIYGQINANPGSSEIYSILPVTDAISYTWSIPVGWAITNDAGTSITVTVGDSGGEISVIAMNPCGMSQSPPLVVSTIVNPILPPTDIKGKWKRSVHHDQIKIYNIISWSASPSPEVIAYNIYRNNIFIAQVPACDRQYSDPAKLNCKKVKYEVTAVGKNGQESIPATVLIKDKRKGASCSSNKS